MAESPANETLDLGVATHHRNRVSRPFASREESLMGVLKSAVGIGAAVAATLLFRRPKAADSIARRKERLHQAYEEAAADKDFQAEMAEIDRAFDATVADGLEPFDRPI